MGIIVGVLSEGSAPCVESPDSPTVIVGKPQTMTGTPSASPMLFGNYSDIATVRQITVIRKFTLKKQDIGAVSQWLASLSGAGVEYNDGTEAKKTIAGFFQLNGELKFTPVSPRLCEVEPEFIGYVLDVNFMLPACVKFVRVDSQTYNITVDGTVVQTHTSSTEGDGTGLNICAGELIWWDELPDETKAVLPMTNDPLPEYYTGMVNGQTTAYMLAYREIIWKINGETIVIGYVRCLPQYRRKILRAYAVYYGVTQAEWVAAGNAMPSVPFIPDIADGENPRLSGPYETSRVNWGECSWYDRRIPTELPTAIASARVGVESYTETGAYTPSYEWRVMWDWVFPNPHPYTYYGIVGIVWVSAWEAIPSYPSSDSLVTVYWNVTDEKVQLLAAGYGEEVVTLLEYDR